MSEGNDRYKEAVEALRELLMGKDVCYQVYVEGANEIEAEDLAEKSLNLWRRATEALEKLDKGEQENESNGSRV